jgi:hypothetical protein
VTDDTSQAPKDIIGFLDFYLVKKAPFQIPDGAREWIVKFGPWITVVLLVFSLPLIFALLGIGAFLAPFGGLGYATGFGMTALFVLVSVALEIFALPGLFARKMSGWKLMFYAQIASAVGSLVAGAIVSGLVGALISLYVLFQVRSLYKE